MPDRRACYACHKAAYRAAHPIRGASHVHRHHARERGTLTFLSFWECAEFFRVTGYHDLRG